MADFDPNTKRDAVVHFNQVVKTIIDGYKNREQRASHWVQKDGIQNCWDARKDPLNKQKKWKCEIELHENGKNTFVTITDFGTWGLTGRRLEQKELYNEQPREERWCRFENYAFQNENVKNQHMLGSRGRGKYVFTGASETGTTLYDTLRDDKVYRIGMRKLEKFSAPTHAAEGQKAKDILKTRTNGILSPLTHVGTRIIIMNPSKQVVEDIKDGQMEQFISETWWEIIEKHDAKIIVKNGKTSKTVEPFTNTLPCSAMTQTQVKRPKTSKNQKTFTKSSIPIENTNFRIKKLYVLYDSDRNFDDRQKGISIQRAGMSIEHYTLAELGTELSDHITGYVVFEDKLQDEMRKTEDPEHYSYNWTRKPTSQIAFVLKKTIKEFATKELGWREATTLKQTKSNQRAKEIARNKANEVAKVMGFGKGGKRPPKTTRPPGPPKTPKIVGIQQNDIEFPKDDTIRVDYGESIKGIGARVINNSKENIKVGIKIEIRSVERDHQVFGKFIFADDNFSSKKEDVSDYCSNLKFKIDKTNFSPGQYKVKASLALITPFGKLRKGQELDVSSKSFFVEMDPPDGGIWEDFIPVDFDTVQGEKSRRAFWDDGSKPGTYVLKYNTEHAAHKAVRNEKEMSQYIYCLTIPELCALDWELDWGVIFSEEHRSQGFGTCLQVQKDTVDKLTDTKYLPGA